MRLSISLSCVLAVFCSSACTDDGDTDSSTEMAEGSETDTPSGDGDGDPSGDGDGDPSGDGDGDPSGDGDGDPSGDGDGDTGGEEVRYADVHPIFEQAGCTSPYCHGIEGAAAGDLLLTDAATSYDNLVGVVASVGVCDLSTRVVSNDPASSILWLRVRPSAQDMGMDCAPKMPDGSEGLSEADAQLVYDWINSGAQP